MQKKKRVLNSEVDEEMNCLEKTWHTIKIVNFIVIVEFLFIIRETFNGPKKKTLPVFCEHICYFLFMLITDVMYTLALYFFAGFHQ